MKLILVAGARPNFMKIAPIMKEIQHYNATNGVNTINPVIVHTGQHYDYEMSKVFFEDLELPEPDVHLSVGSGTHAEQTGKIMIEFEKVLAKEKPDIVVVVGDVNSTLACALATAKFRCARPPNYPSYRPLIAHIEAGLRSFDPSMPEEINRSLTDHLSDLFFTTCEDANKNLQKEGIPEEKIFFVGNVMIDSLLIYRQKSQNSNILQKIDLISSNPTNSMNTVNPMNSIHPYAVLTLHRPENVDDRETLRRIFQSLVELQKYIKIVFSAHPRTQQRIREFDLHNNLINQSPNNFLLIDPLSYLDFLNLMMNAKFVLTDSGGIQEETTVLGLPCLTLRRNTERPVTVREGTNVIVGTDPKRIVDESLKTLNGNGKKSKFPKFWDGKAACRIVEVIQRCSV